jgi:hypothetical protein
VPDSAPGTWYYPTSGGSVEVNKTDGTAGRHSDSHAQYQQWLNANAPQQQQQHFAQQVPMQSSFRRDVIHPPAAPGHLQPQNTFDFMQGQYPPSSMGQYSSHNSGATGHPNAGLNDPVDAARASYQAQTDVFAAFYPDLQPISTRNSSSPDQSQDYNTATPETLHSFAGTPDPAYPPPSHSQTFTSQGQAPPQKLQPPVRQLASNLKQSTHPQQPSQHQQTPSQTRFVTHATPATHPAGGTTSKSNPPQSTSSLAPQNVTWNTNPSPTPATSAGGYYKASNASGSTSRPVAQRVTTGTTGTGPGTAKQGLGLDTGRTAAAVGAAVPSVPAFNAPESGPSTGSTVRFVPPEKTGSKRKRPKKDDRVVQDDATLSYSDSEDDDPLAMTGQIRVGMGGLGVVGRGGRRERGSRL